jgi:hypothetical protein
MSMQVAQERELGRRIPQSGQVLQEAADLVSSQYVARNSGAYLICILDPGNSIPGCQEKRGCLSTKQAFLILGSVPSAWIRLSVIYNSPDRAMK